MSSVDGAEELLISSYKTRRVALSRRCAQVGPGIDPDVARVFAAFYTTTFSGVGWELRSADRPFLAVGRCE
jgi:hypothetical protein